MEEGVSEVLSSVVEDVGEAVSRNIDGAQLLHELLSAPWLHALLKIYECLLQFQRSTPSPLLPCASGLLLERDPDPTKKTMLLAEEPVMTILTLPLLSQPTVSVFPTLPLCTKRELREQNQGAFLLLVGPLLESTQHQLFLQGSTLVGSKESELSQILSGISKKSLQRVHIYLTLLCCIQTNHNSCRMPHNSINMNIINLLWLLGSTKPAAWESSGLLFTPWPTVLSTVVRMHGT
ncbi:hypothetical protein GOODEAATRI_010326 [Goodea atripinnis]|uniref:L27 domain-containing protein n=1 Tax=Goodea atripinnis TaxID=208336 RepID=A0ABV0MHP6_9TELE